MEYGGFCLAELHFCIVLIWGMQIFKCSAWEILPKKIGGKLVVVLLKASKQNNQNM